MTDITENDNFQAVAEPLPLLRYLMFFDPRSGKPNPYPSDPKQLRAYDRCYQWRYNPWYGNERSCKEISDDPFGQNLRSPYEDILPKPAYPLKTFLVSLFNGPGFDVGPTINAASINIVEAFDCEDAGRTALNSANNNGCSTHPWIIAKIKERPNTDFDASPNAAIAQPKPTMPQRTVEFESPPFTVHNMGPRK